MGRSEINKKLYERAPLYKPHKDYGFIEPAKYFVPAPFGLDNKFANMAPKKAEIIAIEKYGHLEE